MSLNSSLMQQFYGMRYLSTYFNKVDKNGDKILSEAELTTFQSTLKDGTNSKTVLAEIIANNKELMFASMDETQGSIMGLSKNDVQTVLNNVINNQSLADQSNSILSGYMSTLDTTGDIKGFKTEFDAYISEKRTNYADNPTQSVSSDKDLNANITEAYSFGHLINNFNEIDLGNKDGVLNEEELLNYKNTLALNPENENLVSILNNIIDNNKELGFSAIDEKTGSILGLTLNDIFVAMVASLSKNQSIDEQAADLRQKYAADFDTTDDAQSFQIAVEDARNASRENTTAYSSDAQYVYLPQEITMINDLTNKFDNYDLNKDGSMNKSELTSFASDYVMDTPSGTAAQKNDAMTRLFNNLNKLQYASVDENEIKVGTDVNFTKNDLRNIFNEEVFYGKTLNNIAIDISSSKGDDFFSKDISSKPTIFEIDAQEAFSSFDENQDGIINIDEVNNNKNDNMAMSQLKSDLLTKGVPLQDLFSLLDTDDSKGLTYAEFDNLLCENNEGNDNSIDMSDIDKAVGMAYNGRLTGDKPDGVISHFAQRGTGDCVLLATMMDINSTEQGKALLGNIVTDNGDGTYTAKFKGSTKAYTVTEADLNANMNLGNGGSYSNGDIDARIIEIAADKWCVENKGQSLHNGIDLKTASELLLGTSQGVLELDTNDSIDYLNNYNNNRGQYIDTVCIPGHLYSLKDVDPEAKKITLINPWDSRKEETMTFDEFISKGGHLAVLPNVAAGMCTESSPVSAFSSIPTDIDTDNDNMVSTNEYLTYYNRADSDHNGRLESPEIKADKIKTEELIAYNTAEYQSAIRLHPDKAQEIYNAKVSLEQQIAAGTATKERIAGYYIESAINNTADYIPDNNKRLDQVNDAYLVFLGRPANQNEINDWVLGQYAGQPIENVIRAIVLAAKAEVQAGRTNGIDVDLINNKDNALIKMFYKMHGVDNVDQGSIDWANWNIAQNGGETFHVLENFRVNNMACTL